MIDPRRMLPVLALAAVLGCSLSADPSSTTTAPAHVPPTSAVATSVGPGPAAPTQVERIDEFVVEGMGVAHLERMTRTVAGVEWTLYRYGYDGTLALDSIQHFFEVVMDPGSGCVYVTGPGSDGSDRRIVVWPEGTEITDEAAGIVRGGLVIEPGRVFSAEGSGSGWWVGGAEEEMLQRCPAADDDSVLTLGNLSPDDGS